MKGTRRARARPQACLLNVFACILVCFCTAWPVTNVNLTSFTRARGIPTTELLHVFLATDDEDLLPLFVAVNSTLSAARDVNSIRFVALLPSDMAEKATQLVHKLIPLTNIERIFTVDSTSLDVHRIRNLPGVGVTKYTKRRELANPYNFAAYYLPHMPKYSTLRRAIYIDTDTVVQADLTDLIGQCCGPQFAVAAVEDCSQRMDTYVSRFALQNMLNRPHLYALHKIHISKVAQLEAALNEICVFNRGVLVLDFVIWRRLQITEEIEEWMRLFAQTLATQGSLLYSYGVSQPPFLLTLYNRYAVLERTWNVRGLGRNEFISAYEVNMLKNTGVEDKVFERAGLHNLSPFISPNAHIAKILHYNGRHKPWKSDRQASSGKALCGPSLRLCAELWWNYISPRAEYLLKALMGEHRALPEE